MSRNTSVAPSPVRRERPADIARVQKRTVLVLSAATILGGLGVGASLSVGALLLAEVSGNDAISGLASAVFSAGTAIAGIPLARLSARRGRRSALVLGSTVAFFGALVAIAGAALGTWPVLAVGIALLGVASAVQLLSRFSATDLATPQNRARDLSLVVWMITVGAVIGPNLIGPGAVVGRWLGIPELSGVFVFALAAQALAAAVNWFGLRPDPLLLARSQSAVDGAAASADSRPRTNTVRITVPAPRLRTGQRLTIAIIAIAQILMVGLMAMTPLHLIHTDGSPEVVGLTLSLHIAGMYALSPVFGALTNRLGRIPTITVGLLLLLASVVLAYIAGPSHLLIQISLTLLGLGWSAVTVAGSVLLTDITPEAERPRWQGLSDTCMSAAGAGAGALSGVVFAVGGFAFLSLIAAGILVIGAVMLVGLGRLARSPRSKQY